MPTMSSASDLEAAAAEISLDQQIACVKRELALRRNVYAKRIANNVMKPIQADFEMAAMTAVLRTLLDIDTGELDALRADYERMRERLTVLERRCNEALGTPNEVSNFLE